MKKVLFFTLYFMLEALIADSQTDLSKLLNLDNATKVASPGKESKVELAVFTNIPMLLFADTENKAARFTNNGAKTGFGAEMLIRAYHNPKNKASLLVGASYIQNPYEFKWFPTYNSSAFYMLKGKYSQVSGLFLSDFRAKLAPNSKNLVYFNAGISLSFLNVSGDYKDVLEVLDLGSTNFNVGYLLSAGLIFDKLDVGIRLHSTSFDFEDNHSVSAAQFQFRLGVHF